MAILTFKCAETKALFELFRVPRFVQIERVALRKLKQLDLAKNINDLKYIICLYLKYDNIIK